MVKQVLTGEISILHYDSMIQIYREMQFKTLISVWIVQFTLNVDVKN